MQTINDRHPSQSICLSAARFDVTCPGIVYRTKRKTSTHARTRKGTWMRKANRQSYFATIRPPRGAPSAAPVVRRTRQVDNGGRSAIVIYLIDLYRTFRELEWTHLDRRRCSLFLE